MGELGGFQHTSMPQERTWLATFFASGQSNGVPIALAVDLHQPTCNTHIYRTCSNKQQALTASASPGTGEEEAEEEEEVGRNDANGRERLQETHLQ